jgi:DNA-binding CsgD family transcriptional regulator
MVRAQRKYLSETERSGIVEQKKDLEQMLEQAEGYGVGGPGEQLDKGKVKAEIARLDKQINDGTAPSARGSEKDALIKRERELKELIRTGMPTRYEMRRPSENPGAVRKHLAWSKRNEENINEYRNIQRILRPTHPESIETLRKDK